MTVNEYRQQAMWTLNPERNQKDILISSVMGLCGEYGEAFGIVKKRADAGHELDKRHLVKELADASCTLPGLPLCRIFR